MKRTLTSIAAASLVLGALAPAAFAGTTTNNSAKVVGTKAVVVNGKLVSAPYELTALDSGNTTAYFGVHYFDQAINALGTGFSSSWDGSTHTWNLTAPGFDASKITGGVGTGNTTIKINGVVAKKINTFSHLDPAGGSQETTYFPVYYINEILASLGVDGSWNGAAGLTASYSVGAPAGVKLAAATSTVVANGASTDTITATVVDANGKTVSNFNGYGNFGYYASNGAVSFSDGTNVTGTAVKFVNGVASFKVLAGTAANLTDTLELTGLYNTYSDAVGSSNAIDTSNWTVGTVDVASVAQVATSIAVTPGSKVIANNNGGENDTVSAEVDDQTGNPMLTGTYPVSFTLTGPATFDGVSAVTAAGAGYGDSTGFTDAAATLYSKKGQSGSIVVTATSGTLSGSAVVTAQSAQDPAKLTVTGPTTNPSADTGSSSVTIGLTDANGVPVAATGTTSVKVTFSDSNIAPQTVVFSAGDTSKTVTFTNTTAEDVTVTATSASLDSASAKVTFTAGAISKLAATPSTTNPLAVSTATPSTTISAQLEDTNGNAIKQAGVEVDFTVSGAPTHSVTLNGTKIDSTNYSTAVVKAVTDANGIASVSAVAQPYAGDTYTIVATAPVQPGITSPKTANAEFKVVNQVASTLSPSVKDGAVSTTYFKAGDTVYFTFTAKDKNGYPIQNDNILITPDAGANLTLVTGDAANTATDNNDGTYSATTDASGKVTAVFTTSASGSFKVAAKDLTSGVSATQSFTNAANTKFAGVGVFDSNNKLVSWTDLAGNVTHLSTPDTVDASKGTVTLTLKAVDNFGNPIVAPNAINVDLAGHGAGSFRTSTNGADVNEVSLAAGSVGKTIYLVNGGTADTALDVTATPDMVLTTAGTASTKTATATVKDGAGNLLAGVTVQFTDATANKTYTAVTNAAGVASVTVPASTDTVTASILGADSSVDTGANFTGKSVTFS